MSLRTAHHGMTPTLSLLLLQSGTPPTTCNTGVCPDPMIASPEKFEVDGVGKLQLDWSDTADMVPTTQFLPSKPLTMGPRTQTERLSWSDWLWNRLEPDEQERLHRNIGHSEWVDHFVSYGSRTQIFEQIRKTCNANMPEPVDPAPTFSMTELSPTRRAALKRMAPAHLPKHLFEDIHSRVPTGLMRRMKEHAPSSDSLLIAKKHANHTMANILTEAYDHKPEDFKFAFCQMCNTVCPVVPECKPVDKFPVHWRGASGGVPCTDHSAMNQGSPGDGGGAFGASQLFFDERAHAQEDYILVECTKKSNAASDLQRSCPGHSVTRVVLDGGPLGDSYARQRMVALGTSPRVGMVRPINTFLQRVHTTPCFPLADFFSSSPEEIQLELEDLATRRVVPVGSDLTFQDTWLPSQKDYFEQYRREFVKRLNLGFLFEDDTKIADLDHRPCASWGRSTADTGVGRANMFTVIKHGTIVNMDTLDQMTCFDLARVHCWPISDIERARHGSVLNLFDCVKNGIITCRDLSAMVGDSWVLRTIGLFMMFTMANMEFKDAHSDKIPLTVTPKKRRRVDDAETVDTTSPNSIMTVEISSDSDGEKNH